MPDPQEDYCPAAAPDGGCIGDEDSVECFLRPNHSGPHWDRTLGIWWFTEEEAEHDGV
jgi:hypothetical protein